MVVVYEGGGGGGCGGGGGGCSGDVVDHVVTWLGVCHSCFVQTELLSLNELWLVVSIISIFCRVAGTCGGSHFSVVFDFPMFQGLAYIVRLVVLYFVFDCFHSECRIFQRIRLNGYICRFLEEGALWAAILC